MRRRQVSQLQQGIGPCAFLHWLLEHTCSGEQSGGMEIHTSSSSSYRKGLEMLNKAKGIEPP